MPVPISREPDDESEKKASLQNKEILFNSDTLKLHPAEPDFLSRRSV